MSMSMAYLGGSMGMLPHGMGRMAGSLSMLAMEFSHASQEGVGLGKMLSSLAFPAAAIAGAAAISEIISWSNAEAEKAQKILDRIKEDTNYAKSPAGEERWQQHRAGEDDAMKQAEDRVIAQEDLLKRTKLDRDDMSKASESLWAIISGDDVAFSKLSEALDASIPGIERNLERFKKAFEDAELNRGTMSLEQMSVVYKKQAVEAAAKAAAMEKEIAAIDFKMELDAAEECYRQWKIQVEKYADQMKQARDIEEEINPAKKFAREALDIEGLVNSGALSEEDAQKKITEMMSQMRTSQHGSGTPFVQSSVFAGPDTGTNTLPQLMRDQIEEAAKTNGLLQRVLDKLGMAS